MGLTMRPSTPALLTVAPDLVANRGEFSAACAACIPERPRVVPPLAPPAVGARGPRRLAGAGCSAGILAPKGDGAAPPEAELAEVGRARARGALVPGLERPATVVILG